MLSLSSQDPRSLCSMTTLSELRDETEVPLIRDILIIC